MIFGSWGNVETNTSKSSAEDLSGGGGQEDSQPVILGFHNYSAGFSQELGENGSKTKKARNAN